MSDDAPDDPGPPRTRPPRSRGPGLFAGLGLALLLVGLGALLISFAYGGDPRAELLGESVPVNAGAGDPIDLSAHNSPTVVRSPRDPASLVIANRIDAPRYSCALHVSSDGGASWRQTPLPVPPGEEPKCYAPDVAFGPDGTLHVSFVTLAGRGNVPHAVWVSSSKDGGRTLSAPTKALGELSFQVRLLADPRIPGRVYLTYLHASEVGLYRYSETGNPVELTGSDDGGKTWGEPARVSDGRRARVVAPTPAIGPRGELYVTYLDLKDDRLDYEGIHQARGGPPHPGTWSVVFSRSRDRGKTWQESVVAPEVKATERFIAFIPPFPSIALDRAGKRFYVAFQDGKAGDIDVRLWRSTDGGGTWASTRVSDTPSNDGRSQYRPRVAVAPDGRVDVVYYDRRADRANVRNEVSLQSSFDGGETFADRVRLSRSFDSRVGQGSERGLADLGSRLALLSTEDRALAVWPDTRSGTMVSGKQDIYRAVVGFAEPARLAGGLKAVLRYGGIAIALLGLALIGRWVMTTQRGRSKDEERRAGQEQAV